MKNTVGFTLKAVETSTAFHVNVESLEGVSQLFALDAKV